MVTQSLPLVSTDILKILAELGHEPPLDASIAGKAGSGRLYYRIGSWPTSHILLISHVQDADYDRFLSVSRHLRAHGLDVPAVYGSDDVLRQVVLEDLGSDLLLSKVHELEFPGGTNLEALENAYQPALVALAQWQEVGTACMASCESLTDRVFDREALRWETDYFSRRFLHEVHGVPEARIAEPALQEAFESLALRVQSHERVLMHRDFQSQNLMLRNDRIWFIDYQGARSGSRWYDLASLLWDPYVQMPMESRRRLFTRFLALRPASDVDVAWTELLDAALQRVMQALGAYGFLTRQKELPWFGQFLTPGLAILRETLAERCGMREIAGVVGELELVKER